VYVPIEVLKIRAQNNKERMINYREYIPKIIKNEGYRGLYKGFWPTFWRDVPGLGLYFFSYEYFKKTFSSFTNREFLIKMLSGGLAGTIAWITSFPMDVVKT
jgi:hypothetical protein